MSYTYIEQSNTNIDIKPICNAPVGAGAVTVGDLHACFPKLLYSLVRHGIIDLSKEAYARLVEIYKTPVEKLTQSHLDEFHQEIESIRLINPHAMLRLIGDETADRGMNDYYILMLLHQLCELQKKQTGQCKLNIIFSNHGAEFLTAIETYTTNTFRPNHLNSYNLGGDNLADGAQARSLVNLDKLLQAKHLKVPFDHVNQVIKTSYLPAILLLDYELDEQAKQFRLFSHAPVDMACIPVLAACFAVPCNIRTPQTTAKTIDLINSAFQKHVQSQRVHELYGAPIQVDAHQQPYLEKYAYESRDPHSILHAITWNRHATLNRDPAIFPGYQTCYIHGHTHRTCEYPTVKNLDDASGKRPTAGWEFHRGQTYKSFVSTQHPRKLKRTAAPSPLVDSDDESTASSNTETASKSSEGNDDSNVQHKSYRLNFSMGSLTLTLLTLLLTTILFIFTPMFIPAFLATIAFGSLILAAIVSTMVLLGSLISTLIAIFVPQKSTTPSFTETFNNLYADSALTQTELDSTVPTSSPVFQHPLNHQDLKSPENNVEKPSPLSIRSP